MEENTHDIVYVEKKNSIDMWKVLMAVVIIFLGWLFLRSCQLGKTQVAEINSLKEEKKKYEAIQDTLSKRIYTLREDSASSFRFAEEQSFLIEQLEDTLSKSETYTKYLAERIRSAYAARDKALGEIDTIDILDNCDDVADAYLKELGLRGKLKISYDSLDFSRKLQLLVANETASTWKSKYTIADNRVKKQDSVINLLKPRNKYLIGISGSYSVFSAGIGPAIGYIDRRGRTIIASVDFTDKGKLYSGKILFPISFRKNK